MTPLARPRQPSEMYLSEAMEIAQVGIVPSLTKGKSGYHFNMCGQRFKIIGHATYEEYMEAIQKNATQLKYPVKDYDNKAPYYYHIVTD